MSHHTTETETRSGAPGPVAPTPATATPAAAHRGPPVSVLTAPNFQPVEFQQLLNDALGAGGPAPGPGTSLPLAGGTMTGPLVLVGDGAADLNPVTLQQMNAAIAALAARVAVLEAAE